MFYQTANNKRTYSLFSSKKNYYVSSGHHSTGFETRFMFILYT